MALDECEPQMIRAFQKDGWQITDKPFTIRTPNGGYLQADVGFEHYQLDKIIRVIILEIKCFTDPKHDAAEFYRTVGQYQTYRAALQLLKDDTPLYLAIPQEAYNRLLQRPEMMLVLTQVQVNYVIIDLEQEVIVAWKP